jgi:hypothetical protein
MSGDVKELVVRLPADLHAQVVARAKEEERSIAATIRVALRLYLKSPLPPGFG